MDFLKKIKFDSKGLVPAIIQDINTDEVLMLAYMNRESLNKTIDTKKTWFYSRSRQKLWNKGEQSGNYQEVKSISYDCDGDTLLVKVNQKGVACHTGEYSCFHNKVIDNSESNEYKRFIDKLYEIIMNRKIERKEGSYTNYLFNEGIDKILKKVGEESSEVIIAAKNDDKEEIIYEISDLVYHTLVLMVDKNIEIEDIKMKLYNRHK